MTVGHGFRNSSLLSSLLLAFTGIFVSMPRPASALERVRVALSVRNVVFLPFYYASDTKIFERYGLDAELIQMRSDLQLAGLISGEIDFTPAVGPATLGVANAMPVKALRSEEHTSELQSRENLVCRLLLEKKKKKNTSSSTKS